MANELDSLLSMFPPITLEEMSSIRLMKRTDTKFITNKGHLMKLLELAKEEYYVQEINGKRISRYQTTYWDTNSHSLYAMHHDGKRPRTKVRVRTYVDSGITFLEIKKKNNHNKTSKKRIEITDEAILKNDTCRQFISERTALNPDELHPCIQNRFERITLVNRGKTERLTIDFNVQFHNLETGEKGKENELVIIELKRDGLVFSPIKQLLIQLRIKPFGFSKYCIGSLLTNKDLKRNLFKPKVIQIRKLVNSSTK